MGPRADKMAAIYDGHLMMSYQWTNQGYRPNSIKTFGTRFVSLVRGTKFLMSNSEHSVKLKETLGGLTREYLDRNVEHVRFLNPI